MATTWKAPTWRMPNEKNQSKFESYSLDFSGTDNYITIDSSTELDNVPLNPYSFSFWFKSSTAGRVLSEKRAANTFLDAQYTIHLESGYVKWYGGAGSSSGTQTTTTLIDDQWHHIVCVAESTTVNKIYVDGQLDVTSSANRISSSAVAGTFRIGSNYVGSYRFVGQISKFCIFDYALSSAQVSSLYNSGSPINPMTLKPAPIAYYPLGGNASTGGSATLSVPNVAVPDASVFDFDGGINEGITVPYNANLEPSTQFTMSCWFKSETSQNSYAYPVYKESSNTAHVAYGFYLQNTTTKATTAIDTGSGVTILQSDNLGDLRDNKWHHLVQTYDGTQMKVYLDGVQSGSAKSATGTVSYSSTYQNLYIGETRHTSPGGYYSFKGKISNVQLFNSSLPETGTDSVETLYNNGVPLTGTQPQEANLKAWYKLDQSANWEADAASTWQIPDNRSAYPQSFNFLSTDNDVLCIDTAVGTGPINSISQSITVSAWCKTTAGGVTRYLVNRNRSTSAVFSNPWTLTKDYFYGGGGRMIWGVQNTNGDTIQVRLTGANDPAGNPLITMNDGKWHHIVGVYDSSTNTCSLYTDGVLQGTATTANFSDYPLPTGYPASRACIGGYNSGSLIPTYLNGGWDGEISNVQIWDKAFTNGNVTTLFNNGVPLTTDIETANLKGSFKLNNTEIFDGSTWSIENKAYPANYESTLSFDGINDKIDFSSSIDLGLNNTISMWLNLDSGYNGILLGEDSYSFDYFLYPYSTGFWVRISGTAINFTDVPTYLTAGSWHHLAVVRSGDTIEVFVDGTPRGSNTGFGTSTNTKFDTIAAKPNGTLPLEGKISNLAGYNTSLDSTAITALYNNGTPETSISSSPVSWWKLDNTTTGIQDSVGSNNGTNNGATKVNTFVSAVAGISKGMTKQNLVFNNVSSLNGESSGMTSANLVTSTLTRQVPYNSYSFSFDGVNDYIETASHPIDFTTGNFTCSAWINVANDGNHQGIFGIRNSTSTALQFYVRNNNKLYSWNGSSDVISTSTIINDVWNHVVLIQDGSDKKFFINGVLDNTVAQGNGSTSTATFKIGFTGNGSEYLNGKVSNCAIFDEALTSTEVLKLYNSGVPSDLSSFNPNPISWWSLGSDSYYNGANYICPDLVGSNNGTSSGMDANALIGNAPNSTVNGTSTNMSVDANLTGSAPNSSNNSFSVNMDYTDRETSVPS